jgi:hypothetical protein
MTNRVEQALDIFNKGFNSKSSQKQAIELVSREYEEIRGKMMNSILDMRDNETLNKDEAHELYWGVPNNLHHFKEKHARTYQELFPEEITEIGELKVLRETFKNTEVKKVQVNNEEKEKKEQVEKTIQEILELRGKQFDEGMILAEHFDGLPVSCNAHLVTNQYGTQFVRCFYYMAGKLTPLNVIIAVAQEHARKNQ